MSPLERWELDLREVGCLVCRRVYSCCTPPSLHHVAEGSGLRSDWAQVPLCFNHHQGIEGLHRLGAREFVIRFRVPGETEWGLLTWAIEDVAKLRAGELQF